MVEKPEKADVALHILSGANFWVGEFLLGMLIPFVIVIYSKGKDVHTLVWASITGMIGIFFMRYDLVHDTQIFPMQTLKIKEYQLAPTWVEYFPSFAEIAISIGAIGVAIAMYYVVSKAFDLEYSEDDLKDSH